MIEWLRRAGAQWLFAPRGRVAGAFCPQWPLPSTKQFYTLHTTLRPAVDTPLAEDFSMSSSSGYDTLSFHSNVSVIRVSLDVSA